MIGATASWVFVLSMIGYSVVGLIASIAGLDATWTSIPFRLLVIALALALALVPLSVLRPVPWSSYVWLFAFWGLYLIRLGWDLYREVDGADYALIYFTGTALAPALALCVARLDWVSTAKWIVFVGALCASLALATVFLELDVGLSHDVTAGRLAYARLNPIILGHTAVTTVVAIMCLMQLRLGWFRTLVYFAVAVMSITYMVLSGARGPVVALAVCSMVFAWKTRRWLWFLILGGLAAALFYHEDTEMILATRLLALASEDLDTSALHRLSVIGNALDQFQESPIFGNAYIEPIEQIYPHNLFIEALMATGVIGTFVLIMLLWRAFRRSLHLMRDGVYLFPLLLLQWFIAAQFSGAIWSFPQLWILLPIVLSRYTPTK